MNAKILTLPLLMLLLAACGKSPQEAATETAIKAATGKDAKVENNGDQSTVTMQTDQGQMKIQTGAGLSLPGDFPKDVYLPADYQIQNVVQMGPVNTVVLAVNGESQALVAEITGKMEAQGWKTAMSMQSGDHGSLLTFTQDKRSAVYTVAPSPDGKLTVQVQHTEEKNSP